MNLVIKVVSNPKNAYLDGQYIEDFYKNYGFICGTLDRKEAQIFTSMKSAMDFWTTYLPKHTILVENHFD